MGMGEVMVKNASMVGLVGDEEWWVMESVSQGSYDEEELNLLLR